MRVTDAGVPVETLIKVVKDSVRQAAAAPSWQATDLQVDSVQLSLGVVASHRADGELAFCVPFSGMNLGLGAKVTKKDTHTVDLTLVPPKGPAAHRTSEEAEGVLVNAITAIRDAVAKAAGGDDPWTVSAGTIDISFTLMPNGAISVGADGELADGLTNTLRIGLVSGRK